MRRDDSPAPRLVTCAFRPCDALALQTKALAASVTDYGAAGAPCVGVMEPGSYNLLLVEAPAGVAAWTAEYPTRAQCEQAAGAMRWQMRERPRIVVTHACTAKGQ